MHEARIGSERAEHVTAAAPDTADQLRAGQPERLVLEQQSEIVGERDAQRAASSVA
jgi:hypothetical protein